MRHRPQAVGVTPSTSGAFDARTDLPGVGSARDDAEAERIEGVELGQRRQIRIGVAAAGRDDLEQVPRHRGEFAAERLQRVGLRDHPRGRRRGRCRRRCSRRARVPCSRRCDVVTGVDGPRARPAGCTNGRSRSASRRDLRRSRSCRGARTSVAHVVGVDRTAAAVEAGPRLRSARWPRCSSCRCRRRRSPPGREGAAAEQRFLVGREALAEGLSGDCEEAVAAVAERADAVAGVVVDANQRGGDGGAARRRDGAGGRVAEQSLVGTADRAPGRAGEQRRYAGRDRTRGAARSPETVEGREAAQRRIHLGGGSAQRAAHREERLVRRLERQDLVLEGGIDHQRAGAPDLPVAARHDGVGVAVGVGVDEAVRVAVGRHPRRLASRRGSRVRCRSRTSRDGPPCAGGRWSDRRCARSRVDAAHVREVVVAVEVGELEREALVAPLEACAALEPLDVVPRRFRRVAADEPGAREAMCEVAGRESAHRFHGERLAAAADVGGLEVVDVDREFEAHVLHLADVVERPGAARGPQADARFLEAPAATRARSPAG